jgi:hypothetical protein
MSISFTTLPSSIELTVAWFLANPIVHPGEVKLFNDLFKPTFWSAINQEYTDETVWGLVPVYTLDSRLRQQYGIPAGKAKWAYTQLGLLIHQNLQLRINDQSRVYLQSALDAVARILMPTSKRPRTDGERKNKEEETDDPSA